MRPGARSGLGDRVEQALSFVGITSERVEKWLRRPCGCKERQAKLNRLGAWAARVLTEWLDLGNEAAAKTNLEEVLRADS